MAGRRSIVIGGGFYGCMMALALRMSGHDVMLLEARGGLMEEASAINQARVHGGFHYPRNFATAYRSHSNMAAFIAEFGVAVREDFTHLYAVARVGSKVSSRRFEDMFKGMGARIAPAKGEHERLFDPRLVEKVFEVREPVFDYTVIRAMLAERMGLEGVRVETGCAVTRLEKLALGWVVHTADGRGRAADGVYVATYAALNSLLHASGVATVPLKHEATEMALVALPEELRQVGVTVMDGPFFSVLPYPSRGLHTLSHVRYTPRASWVDGERAVDGAAKLAETRLSSAAPYMLRDASRYMPGLAGAVVEDSLYANKTLLERNEVDDGRPIFYHPDWAGMEGLTLLMGSKVDNIYDVLNAAGLPIPGFADAVRRAA